MDNHEFAKRLSVWLSAYTNEVIEKQNNPIEIFEIEKM